MKSCGRSTNPEIQLADNPSRVSPFALRCINTRTPRRHVIKETVILATGSSDATYLIVRPFHFDVSLTIYVYILTLRSLIQTLACQRFSWQKRFSSFFPSDPKAPSGCHGFLRHNAATLMQWQCTVHGKTLRDLPSSQLPSSWARAVPSAVYLRANRYRYCWTGGS